MQGDNPQENNKKNNSIINEIPVKKPNASIQKRFYEKMLSQMVHNTNKYKKGSEKLSDQNSVLKNETDLPKRPCKHPMLTYSCVAFTQQFAKAFSLDRF